MFADSARRYHASNFSIESSAIDSQTYSFLRFLVRSHGLCESRIKKNVLQMSLVDFASGHHPFIHAANGIIFWSMRNVERPNTHTHTHSLMSVLNDLYAVSQCAMIIYAIMKMSTARTLTACLQFYRVGVLTFAAALIMLTQLKVIAGRSGDVYNVQSSPPCADNPHIHYQLRVAEVLKTKQSNST